MKKKLSVFMIFLLIFTAFSHDWFSNTKRSTENINQKPNIIIITTTDLGWDDISLHGNPLAVTPNIDTFSKHGVTLNNHYINSFEFATRVELMTGKYSSRLGLHQDLTSNFLPVGLPENVTTIPKILKEQGYKNHYVGKWGLGFNKKSSLPIFHGFDSFFGSISNLPLNYYNFTSTENNFTGFDLYNKTEPVNISNTYSQSLFTDVATDLIYESAKNPDSPFFLFLSLQIPQSEEGIYDSVPENFLEYFNGIYADKPNKNHAAMVMALDVSIGRIMDSLASSSILEKSVIIILPQSASKACNISDGGGCNYPLRGGYGTVWEGGIRNTALFYGSFIKTQGKIINEMIHITDWLPTLTALAKYDNSHLTNIDGANILPTLTENKETKRTYMLFDVETRYGEIMALRMHEYKLVVGQKLGFESAWNKERVVTKQQTDNLIFPGFKPSIDSSINFSSIVLCDSGYPHPFLNIHAPPCKPNVEPCLFNLEWDPCEYHNLAGFMQRTANFILSKLIEIKRNIAQQPVNKNISVYILAGNHSGYWKWSDNEINENSNLTTDFTNSSAGINTKISIQNDTSLSSEKNSLIQSNDTMKSGMKHFDKEIYGVVETKNKNLNEDKPLSDDEIENAWNVEHQTLNLDHFKDLKKENKSINLTKTSNLTNFTNITRQEISNISELFHNNTWVESKNITNITNSSIPITKTEVFEIYDTPSDNDLSILSINNTIPLQLLPENQKDETGFKRTNLPENTIDYKISLSKGKTSINGADASSTDAFLKTKAIAGKLYDEKSNKYSSEKQLTSLDDENLRILSSDSETAKVYPLSQEINEKQFNSKNTSFEEFFIDWDLLSKETAIITKPPEMNSKVNTMNIPQNLVTSEPLSPKSFLFEPYMQEETDNTNENAMFQRTIKDNPKINTFVEAHSDADKNTATNQHKLSFGTEIDDDAFLKEYKNSIKTVKPPVFPPTTSNNFKKDFNIPVDEIHNNFESSPPNSAVSIDKIRDNFLLEKSGSRAVNSGLDVVFDDFKGKKMPFHGSLNVGNSQRYEFEGIANDVSDLDSSLSIPQKYLSSKFNEDQNHIYGINVLQQSLPQNIVNKTEITESASNIKLIDQINSTNFSLSKEKQIEKYKSENEQKKIAKSYIPESGIIGDEVSPSRNSDDIFKIFSSIENEKNSSKDVSKDLTSKVIQISNIINELPMILTNQTYINQNGSFMNMTVMSIDSNLSDTNPEKKGYPIALPYKSPIISSTVASTVVAVVLSAFVIIGMALIAIVALVSKSYGKAPPAKSVAVSASPASSLTPSGSGNLNTSSLPLSPRRTNRLNR